MKANARILLVEDEPSIADNVQYALKAASFEVIWAASGQEALSAFSNQVPDLVILDIGLPDMDGFEVCRKLRTLSDLPILFLSARSDEIDRVVGLELGADDYICKPFSPRELVARVKANLRRTQLSVACEPNLASKKVGLLSIDMASRTVQFSGKEVAITRYEFGILEVMMQHPKRVYSREELLIKVWNEPNDSIDRVVDTHIKTLRAKLKAIDSNSEAIKTHRGIGYSLDVS